MRARLAVCLLAASAAAALSASSAPAERGPSSTPVGYRCAADTIHPNQTRLLAGPHATDWLRFVPGGPNQIITAWGAGVGPGLAPIAQQLVVFEPLGGGSYRKVAESPMEILTEGQDTGFRIRIPVKGAKLVGLYGPRGTLACRNEESMFESASPVSMWSDGGALVGETMTFQTEEGVGTPLSVSVEVDEDRDGYGDGSQDRCLETASAGSDCPIDVNVSEVEVKRRAILLEVTSEARAQIRVRGEFLWRVPADEPGEPRRLVGADTNTKRKRVRPDFPASFRLPLPGNVVRRLDRLPARRSMLARIGVRVTDSDGWQSSVPLRVVLRGRG
jgi:hypothetical protein